MSKPLSEMSLEELWQLFPIILCEHKAEWKVWYQEEYTFLCNLFKAKPICQISHIGSTAIHGIWAKPIVDLLVEIPKECDQTEYKSILLQNGYLCMNQDQRRMTFNKGYTEHGFDERVFHLHLRYEGDNDEVYFRNYMNENPALAKQYEALKLSLWKPYEHDRDGYTNAKGDLVRKYTEEAKKQKTVL
ncbi:GrpB family protein [Anaerosporobacter faecicola]|uniref:GrpB family protein n=1 Tax=Anaerosporobacter faecicola TaxID=2718714 RepID=UPI00143A9FF9|nr:GrpB family protein [Anaerosporobacter faecicola]